MRPCIIAGDPPVVSSPPFPPPSADGSSSSSSSSLPIPSPARNSKHPRRRSSPEEEAPAPRPDQIRWPTATSPGESSRSRLRSDCLGVDLPTPLTRFPPFLFFFFIFPFCADFLFLLSVCSRLVWICAGDAATPQRARCGRFFFFLCIADFGDGVVFFRGLGSCCSDGFGLVCLCSAGNQRVSVGGEHALLQRHDPWPGTVPL